MQTSAQKEASIRMGNVVLTVGGVNVGLLEEAKVNINYTVSQLRAHNGYLPPKKRIDAIQLSASLYEIDLTNISAIDGFGILSSVAASPVTVTAEAHGTGWTQGKPIKLANKDGDNTVVGSIVVKAAGSALTLNTDYRIYVGDGTNGELGYTYITPVTSQAGAITVDYSYTPNASKTITFNDLKKAVGTYEIAFTNTDANGKIFKITIPVGYSSESFELPFVSDDAVDDTMKMPVTFSAYPDSNGTMLTIYDEQSVI